MENSRVSLILTAGESSIPMNSLHILINKLFSDQVV